MTSLPRFRFLLAQDNYLIADDIAAALEQAGAVVIGPVPTVEQALEKLARSDDVDVGILDINLKGHTAFPVADALRRHSIPIVFFSCYDDITIPARFSGAVRISKVQGIPEVVAAAFAQRERQAGRQFHADYSIIDLLPQLRLHARQLVENNGVADDLVQRALEAAIASIERGDAIEPPARKLHALLLQAYVQSRHH